MNISRVTRSNRSYAEHNRKKQGSQEDLEVALRRVKEGNPLNIQEINALTQNGYNTRWKGEEEGIIYIDGKSIQFTIDPLS